jgi:hypothetical protein
VTIKSNQYTPADIRSSIHNDREWRDIALAQALKAASLEEAIRRHVAASKPSERRPHDKKLHDLMRQICD